MRTLHQLRMAGTISTHNGSSVAWKRDCCILRGGKDGITRCALACNFPLQLGQSYSEIPFCPKISSTTTRSQHQSINHALTARFTNTLHRQAIASIGYHHIIIMPPFRNPFNKKAPPVNGVPATADENVRPSLGVRSDHASERSSYAGSRASSSLSIKPRKEETAEYKLSGMRPKHYVTNMKLKDRADPIVLVVNDSGVYLPVGVPEGLDAII